jgi:hypothetical protein
MPFENRLADLHSFLLVVNSLKLLNKAVKTVTQEGFALLEVCFGEKVGLKQFTEVSYALVLVLLENDVHFPKTRSHGFAKHGV